MLVFITKTLKIVKRIFRSILHGFYADDVNLLGYNIDTTMENTETLIDANNEVGLEINVEKTK
jgi:hypothetical protein